MLNKYFQGILLPIRIMNVHSIAQDKVISSENALLETMIRLGNHWGLVVVQCVVWAVQIILQL